MTFHEREQGPLRGHDIGQLRHELRTPVNAVLGYGEMLLEEAPSQRVALDDILAAARDVLAAIEQVLPPSAAEVARGEIAALHDAIRPCQARILEATDALLACGEIADNPSFVSDLGRIRAAAERLVTIGAHASARSAPGMSSPGSTSADEMPTIMVKTGHTAVTGTGLPSPKGSGAARILVVDDVEDNRSILERRLEREGHQVECAQDGRQALEKIAARRFDLILLDIMMPEVDGFEVLARLKQSPDTRDIPVIMISALDDLGSVVRCIEQGAEDHLAKPFEPVLLRARINASLDKKRLRDREREYLAEVKTIAEAASAVDEGCYESASLSRTAVRSDELGRLARVFDAMATEVKAREHRLRRQVFELRQEIEAARRGAEVTGQADTRLPIGHVLAGRYEILLVVGFGAMGTVYKAYDRELAELVAVKVLRPELLSEPAVVDRFKAEVRLARRISHPSVVRTHDLGEWDGVHYLTMEYVEGLTARALIDSRGRLGVAAVLAIGRQLAQALAVAHAQGVIHRDIKPQNLLLDEQGALKVMDFGVSRLSDSAGGSADVGMMIGTPAYMAPEQLLAAKVDARIDLYATGVVLYECLTGRLPFVAPSPAALIAKVLNEDPAEAVAAGEDTPAALSALIARLLAKEPEARPSSATELLSLLDQIG